MLSQFGAAIKTDMTLAQIQQLSVLAQKLDKSKIKNVVLDENYCDYAFTPDGQSILIGRRAKIAELRDAFFSSEGIASAVTPTP
jgi:hypothetical protein